LKEINRFVGTDVFDFILANSSRPASELLKVYAEEGEFIENDLKESRVVLSDFLGPLGKNRKADLIKRSLIRHDSDKLAKELMKIVNHL